MLREPEPPIRRATANVLTPSGNAHAHGIGLTAGAELVRACTLHLQLRPRRRAAKGLDRLEILEVRCWPRTNRQRKAVTRERPLLAVRRPSRAAACLHGLSVPEASRSGVRL